MMEHDDVIRIVFIERYKTIKSQGHTDDLYADSIVADLIYRISMFNLSKEVDNMVERDQMYQKSVWKKMVWDRAWSLEEMVWRIEYRLQKSLDLVCSINPNPEYLTWWALSDKYPEYINICETMARLVCHAS